MIDESLIGKEKSIKERLASMPEFLLSRTAQQMKQDAENQERWARSVASPFAQGAPAEVARARAVRLEEDWRGTLKQVRGQMALSTIPEEIEALNNAFITVTRQLAEALATQGRFQEAEHYAKLTGWEEADAYHHLAKALARADDDRCGPKCDLAFSADRNRLTQYDAVMEVFSPEHGQVVTVFRCAMCGSLNGRPLTEKDRPYQKQREARRRARTLVAGLNHEQAAAALKREKLTTETTFPQ